VPWILSEYDEVTDAEVVTLTSFETDRLRVSECVPSDVQLGLRDIVESAEGEGDGESDTLRDTVDVRDSTIVRDGDHSVVGESEEDNDGRSDRLLETDTEAFAVAVQLGAGVQLSVADLEPLGAGVVSTEDVPLRLSVRVRAKVLE